MSDGQDDAPAPRTGPIFEPTEGAIHGNSTGSGFNPYDYSGSPDLAGTGSTVLARFNSASPETMKQFASFLDDRGLLSGLVGSEIQNGALSQFGDADGLNVERLKAAATSDESPFNKMLAQALLDRLDTVNTDGDKGHISMKELRKWAGKSPYLAYDKDNPGKKPEHWLNNPRREA